MEAFAAALDVTDPANFYFSQGVLGVSCAGLIYVVAKIWAKMETERAAHKIEMAAEQQTHKVELASKNALIKELYEDRIAEVGASREYVKAFQATLDAILVSVNGGKQSK